jgi:hypothetical protein
VIVFVEITKQDIAQSVPGNPLRNPVLLAIKRTLGASYVCILPGVVAVFHSIEKRTNYELTDRVRGLIQLASTGKLTECDFTLESK